MIEKVLCLRVEGGGLRDKGLEIVSIERLHNSLLSFTFQVSSFKFLDFKNLRIRELTNIDIELIGKPFAGVVEGPVLGIHDEINGATTGIADVTAVAVSARMKSK